MEYYSVKDFEKFQHYSKDLEDGKRNPIWVKLYGSIYHDHTLSCLPVVVRYTYIGLITVASETRNRIPDDTVWLAKRLAVDARTARVAWKTLIDVGLLVKAASTGENAPTLNASPIREEKRREEEKREEETQTPPPVNHSPDPVKPERAKPETLWPEGFALTGPMIQYAKDQGVYAQREFEGFRDNALAKGLKYRDWVAAWRTWCRRAVEFGRASPKQPLDRRWEANAPPAEAVKRQYEGQGLVDIRPMLADYNEKMAKKAS